ncbi:MAG TPA: hypothetical protein VFW04_01000 [Gemmatimonadaceae bacterium]|nr:hypothetical protein [Gemmatimonadaceae bacterium]
MNLCQLGEGPDVLDVVANHATRQLHPRVRAKPSAAHPDSDANAAPRNVMSLEHPVDGDGAHQAQRAKHPVIPGTTHRQAKLLRSFHFSGLYSKVRHCTAGLG